ncbi:MAG: HigA family addiction module antidote protein [bacterium]|nr:HigA family addiction module antidote protein [bacterium]
MEPKFDNFAEPPGEIIREEMEARGWAQTDLAFILGYSEQTVNKLLNGKTGLTADMAKALAEAFGTSAELWAGLQKEWELRCAREPDQAIKARALMQGVYPVREMINRGWLEKGEQSVLEMQFMRFFEVNRMEDIDYLEFAAAAKKTNEISHTPEELAWLYRVRHVARSVTAPKYNEDGFKAALTELRTLMIDAEDVRHVADVLNRSGVRLVIVEKIGNCKVDGVCTWLNDDEPVIGLTLRHNRLDNFWFVLIHECEHILRGHGKGTRGIIDDLDGEGASDGEGVAKEERIANSASLDFAVSREHIMSFYLRKKPYISEKDVVGFAATSEVHPAIVVGQIQYIKDDFAWLRKWLVSVKNHLLSTCAVDGFGESANVKL